MELPSLECNGSRHTCGGHCLSNRPVICGTTTADTPFGYEVVFETEPAELGGLNSTPSEITNTQDNHQTSNASSYPVKPGHILWLGQAVRHSVLPVDEYPDVRGVAVVEEEERKHVTLTARDAQVAAEFAAKFEALGLADPAAEAKMWEQKLQVAGQPRTETAEEGSEMMLLTPSRDSSLQARSLIGTACKKPRCGECTKPLAREETRLCSACAANVRTASRVARQEGAKYRPPMYQDSFSTRTSTLRISNLDTDDDAQYIEAELRHMFEGCGRIRRVSVPLDRWSREPRGFGFVEFNDGKAADRAMREHEQNPYVHGYMRLQLEVVQDMQPDMWGGSSGSSDASRKQYDFSGLKRLI